MENKRRVELSVLYKLLKAKRPFAIIGLIFTFLSIFVMFPLILILSATLKEPYEKYDFNAIKENGVEKKAKITDIASINNVTINGLHPDLISYEYNNKGQTISDKFETLDREITKSYEVGKVITVLSYNNQSVIKSLEPFGFPFGMFLIMPAIFLLIGIPFLLIGLIPALKTFNLYKTGIIMDANVVSIESNGGLIAFRGQQASFLVNYYFSDSIGGKVFGASSTTDYLILNETKAGDSVKIFVAENNNSKSCLVPRLEAAKYNWSS